MNIIIYNNYSINENTDWKRFSLYCPTAYDK